MRPDGPCPWYTLITQRCHLLQKVVGVIGAHLLNGGAMPGTVFSESGYPTGRAPIGCFPEATTHSDLLPFQVQETDRPSAPLSFKARRRRRAFNTPTSEASRKPPGLRHSHPSRSRKPTGLRHLDHPRSRKMSGFQRCHLRCFPEVATHSDLLLARKAYTLVTH